MKIKSYIRNKVLGNSAVGTNNLIDRETWLKKSLENIPTGSRILDAGAGEMQYKKWCSHLKYVSQDFAQYDPSKFNVGLQMDNWDYKGLDIVCDIIQIPEPDQSFDTIMCIEVIEHIPDPAKVFPEFSRLLKPGGSLILTAPFCSLTHFAPYHFSTGFSKFYYEKHLADHGFDNIEITFNGNFFEYMAQETRRLPVIANKYAGQSLSVFERLMNRYYLRMLDRFSKIDKGSEEILCYGLQIQARKK